MISCTEAKKVWNVYRFWKRQSRLKLWVSSGRAFDIVLRFTRPCEGHTCVGCQLSRSHVSLTLVLCPKACIPSNRVFNVYWVTVAENKVPSKMLCQDWLFILLIIFELWRLFPQEGFVSKSCKFSAIHFYRFKNLSC